MKLSSTWKSIVLGVLLFGAGGVVGSVVTHQFIKHALTQAFDFDAWPDGIVRTLDDKLTLTGDQKSRIRAISEAMAGQLKATLKNSLNDSGRIIVHAQHQIDDVLTPEQRTIHAEMKARFRASLKEGLGFTLPDE
jgi:hypothetical protein